MKILLVAINAKYIHTNLAVASLRAYTKRTGHSVEIYETSINQRTEEILGEIYKKEADVICFSCYIWNMRIVEELSLELKKIQKDVPLWLGGPEVSYDSARYLESAPHIKGIMVGEGEESFARLVAYYHKEGAGELPQIPGICYREGDEICSTSPGKPLELGAIPFVYEDQPLPENRIVYYESSRGCPFSCSYCLSSVEQGVRFRPLSMVKKELSFFIEHKVPQVKFVDRTFNCNHDHAMEIIRHIKKEDQGWTNFHFEISADLLTKEEIEECRSLRPGLIQFEVGVQSTYDKTVEEIRRTMDLKQVKDKVLAIAEGGNIHQHLDLIAGLPFEDYERFQASFDEIYALQPDQLQLGFLKLLKGSYMMAKAIEYEMEYHSYPPYEILSTKWISYHQLQKIKLVEEMLEVYYNSGQFQITAQLLSCIEPSPFAFFLSLGEYYETKGLLHQSHSRAARCEILLTFVEERHGEREGLWKESLTFDLYFRENMKSRPAFARENGVPKKEYQRYCGKGKLWHIEAFHFHFPKKKQIHIPALPLYDKDEVWMLFDYEHRDPLDHQATVTEIRKGAQDCEEKNP